MPWSTPSSSKGGAAWLAATVIIGGLLHACSDPTVADAGPSTATTPLTSKDVPALHESVQSAVAEGTPVVAFVHHAGARLEPCGCVAGMHGGLVRRATLLSRVARDQQLTLEGGGWSGGSVDYQRVKAGFYLRGLAQAGIDAVAIGSKEVRLGADHLGGLLTAADSAGLSVVSANLRRTDGSAVVPSLTRVEAGGTTFVVTSVIDEHSEGEGLQALPPADALLALLPQIGDAELVVLADLDADAMEELARAVPGIAAIVGGDVKQPSRRATAIGRTRIVHVANEGKTLGWWPWRDETCSFELIEDTVPDHPAIRNLIGTYQQTLGSMNLAIDESVGGLTALTRDDGLTYVGDATCMTCHQGAHQVWSESRHEHSLATLKEKGYHRDPECLRCHVTGLGLPDGYGRLGANEHLGTVSCESCHGRGSQHVAERSRAKPASGTLTPTTPATCVRCHDSENSPHFDYATYWPKIVHTSR